MGSGPPSGTVTFLFTDVVGSTALWERAPEVMRAAIARHDVLLRTVIDEHGGYVFATAGDGFAAAFARAGDAIGAAVAAQAALMTERWPDGGALSVRMGVHSGEADERDGGFFGPAVNRAARIMSVAHGRQILTSAVTAGLVAGAPGIELRPVGSRRLRGVSQPVDVVVVLADDVGLDATPPVVALEGNLPRPVTEYVGDLAALRRRVGRLSGRRLVTLTGSGGVGKTRTAIEIGWWSSDQFPGGAWLVELAPLGAGEAVPAAVAATLGVQLHPGSTMTDSILGWLRARPTLLIIDNCEHVLDDVATLVAAVQAGAPDTTVLATSREPLGLAGEIVRRVPSLDPATDAMQLFAERAATAADGFVIDDDNRDEVRAICTRLDGIPLAIELAAARVRALTPAEILARLDDRFRLLHGTGRDRPERHQTLRATVAWSVQLLTPAQRCLFERLSVFTGPFSLADAEAVCGFDPLDEAGIVDLLSALVDRSMVVAEHGGEGTSRYRLLETLRQYGEQAVTTDPERLAAVRDRHLAHFLDHAEQWSAQQATAEEPAANRAFAHSWDNLRAAFNWALAARRGRDVADLLHATYWFAVHTGRWEHRQWAVTARAAGADTAQVATAAMVLWAGLAGHSETVGEVLAKLDPTGAGLLPRDVEVIWQARAALAFMTNDRDGIEAATAWLNEAEPRCSNPITEAWILSNILAGTMSAPEPGIRDRTFRLAQTSHSPSVKAIAGFSFYGFRYSNLEPVAEHDRDDMLDGLQHALSCSQAAGNAFVEATCMALMVSPLADRGKPCDAAVLRASVDRLSEIRYDMALTFLVARLAIWFVHVGRPNVATLLDEYFRKSVGDSFPAHYQVTIQQLDQLLDRHQFTAERTRGRNMDANDLTDYLHNEFATLNVEAARSSR